MSRGESSDGLMWPCECGCAAVAPILCAAVAPILCAAPAVTAEGEAAAVPQ